MTISPPARRLESAPGWSRETATFRHRLPRSAGELTTHLHGGHNTSRDDGSPAA